MSLSRRQRLPSKQRQPLQILRMILELLNWRIGVPSVFSLKNKLTVVVFKNSSLFPKQHFLIKIYEINSQT